MTPDLQQEFRMLSERAALQLRDVPASGSYRHVFSFWVRPSFSSSYRCTVYSPLPFAKEAQPFVSFTIWRMDLDWEKMRSPVERLKYPKDLVPTMQDDVLWLTAGDVEAMEGRIRGVSIPLFLGQGRIAGCDGTVFEFQYDEPLFGASIRWWQDHPIEWRPFTNEVMRVATELEDRRKAKIQPCDTTTGGPTTQVRNPGVV